MTTRLYDLSRLFKDKEQKVTIIDNKVVVETTTIGNMPMKYGSRGIFALSVDDDNSVVITLLKQDKIAGKGKTKPYPTYLDKPAERPEI